MLRISELHKPLATYRLNEAGDISSVKWAVGYREPQHHTLDPAGTQDHALGSLF
jgi:hypothetical protein